jgi:hypothetical protein
MKNSIAKSFSIVVDKIHGANQIQKQQLMAELSSFEVLNQFHM